MKKQILYKFFALILLVFTPLFLSGCDEIYTEADIKQAKQEAYREGYEIGYSRGAEEQKEQDHEELLMDGFSIKNIYDEVFKEFGMTPSQAFNTYDSYNCDRDHGEITWDEYQKAIEVMVYVSCIFPEE